MNFWRLVNPELFTEAVITGHHNHLLFMPTALLAILAAWVLLPVTDRYNNIKTPYRYFWLSAGSIAMGIGIWAMHFTSMLVYRLPFAISYDLSTTIVSMIPAMLASASSIALYASARNSKMKLFQAALCMAVGIGTMHYLGMEAIIVPAAMYYVPTYFILSIAAAAILALVGLYAKIIFSQIPWLPRFLGTLVGSVVLGLAVSSMHLIAMHATYFVADQGVLLAGAAIDGALNMQHHTMPSSSHNMTPTGLMFGIVASTLFILALIVIGTRVDRRLNLMANSLKQSELRFQRLAETTQMAIFTFDESSVTYTNPALSKITGYSTDELLSMSLQDVFNIEFQDFATGILHSSSHVGQGFYEQFEVKTKTGETLWLYFSVTLAEIDQQATCLASACDISEQKQAELSLRKLAYSDQLTGLGNRAMFMDRLQHHLDLQPRRRSEGQSCVMLLDLDNFKAINDTFGHAVGDKLLHDVAIRLAPLARFCDTVARIGGDEFVILFEEMSTEHNTSLIAERILDHMQEPFLVNSREINVQTSIGVVMLKTESYQTPDQVLHDADIALYRAKDQGRACWVLYDDEIDAKVKRARVLQSELRTALHENLLQLYYQPIFNAMSHELRGFEALARWQRNNGEWVSPGEFIPLAEEIGLIADLGNWALDTASKQLGEWNRELQAGAYYISVNVAGDSFHDERFYRLVAQNIQRYSILRGQLKLELTERMLVTDNPLILSKLNDLINMGCELMIDDFGTGYSSLSYLHRLPVQTLKIDRSFIVNLETDEGSKSVVKSIIALASSLNMNIISEGVETSQQARLLANLGSTQLQGFLLGRPSPLNEATAILEKALLDEGKINTLPVRRASFS